MARTEITKKTAKYPCQISENQDGDYNMADGKFKNPHIDTELWSHISKSQHDGGKIEFNWPQTSVIT